MIIQGKDARVSETDVFQEICAALVILAMVWLGRGASKSDKEWYDDVERQKRGED